MDRFGARRHVAFGIVIGVEGLTGRDEIDHFYAADLDHSVAGFRVQSGGFGIENDFTHSRCYRPDSWEIQGEG